MVKCIHNRPPCFEYRVMKTNIDNGNVFIHKGKHIKGGIGCVYDSSWVITELHKNNTTEIISDCTPSFQVTMLAEESLYCTIKITRYPAA